MLLRTTVSAARVGGCGGRTTKRIRATGLSSCSGNTLLETSAEATSSTTSSPIQTRTMATLKIDNMNPAVKKMEYAVRGPLVIRANEIEKEIEQVFTREREKKGVEQ